MKFLTPNDDGRIEILTKAVMELKGNINFMTESLKSLEDRQKQLIAYLSRMQRQASGPRVPDYAVDLIDWESYGMKPPLKP